MTPHVVAFPSSPLYGAASIQGSKQLRASHYLIAPKLEWPWAVFIGELLCLGDNSDVGGSDAT
jgi:hypothetical protein